MSTARKKAASKAPAKNISPKVGVSTSKSPPTAFSGGYSRPPLLVATSLLRGNLTSGESAADTPGEQTLEANAQQEADLLEQLNQEATIAMGALVQLTDE